MAATVIHTNMIIYTCAFQLLYTYVYGYVIKHATCVTATLIKQQKRYYITERFDRCSFPPVARIMTAWLELDAACVQVGLQIPRISTSTFGQHAYGP